MQTQAYLDWFADGSKDGSEDWSGSSKLDQLSGNKAGDECVVLVATHDEEASKKQDVRDSGRRGGVKRIKPFLTAAEESLDSARLVASCLEDIVKTSKFVHAQVWRLSAEEGVLCYRCPCVC